MLLKPVNLRSIQTILLSALGVAASSAVSLADCGGSFDLPKDHFDGVDSFGYVSYWDKIADIDIGEDTPLPLVIGFKSNRETSSPYLGHGWVMPLLDSYMIQTGENTFEIMKPTGYTSGFGRDPKSLTTIGGVKGWKGEIGSNTIKVWAPCGWSLTYTMGRLTEMGTPKGKRVIVKRDQAGQVDDVTMDGQILLKVLKGVRGKVEGLEVEGKKLAIILEEKPRIQSVQGKIVVAGKDLSLGEVQNSDDSSESMKTYNYGVVESLQPIMIVKQPRQSERKIVWNPENKKITKDGDWTYKITCDQGEIENAAIERKDTNGQSEFWHNSSLKGEEISRDVNGIQTIISRYTSGILNGKIRSIFQVHGNETSIVERNTYNEEGEIVRSIRGKYEIHFLNGRVERAFLNGEPRWFRQGLQNELVRPL